MPLAEIRGNGGLRLWALPELLGLTETALVVVCPRCKTPNTWTRSYQQAG